MSFMRRWRLPIAGGVAIVALLLGIAWKRNGDNGGQLPAEPFRIAGNFYFVGANDVSAFLLTGPDGHVLLDGGYPGTASMIAASVEQLGFDMGDVRVLINSEPHLDHAGGLAALQRMSGAALYASQESAYSLATGGDDPDIILPLRALIRLGVLAYPKARVDHVVRDGDVVRVGPLALTAHITGGHTRGCTSWSFDVQEGERTLKVVSACSLIVLGGMRYAEQGADLERSFATLRGLPADIWVTSHGRLWGRYRKFAARDTAADPVAPFLDRAGYLEYVDTAEARFRRGVVQ